MLWSQEIHKYHIGPKMPKAMLSHGSAQIHHRPISQSNGTTDSAKFDHMQQGGTILSINGHSSLAPPACSESQWAKFLSKR